MRRIPKMVYDRFARSTNLSVNIADSFYRNQFFSFTSGRRYFGERKNDRNLEYLISLVRNDPICHVKFSRKLYLRIVTLSRPLAANLLP